jgi:hypothetical protein
VLRETIVDKVRKLIALASSPYEEEARSSAFKAAALIREFNLDIIDPASRYTATPDSDTRSVEWPRWVYITARYSGYCKTCREPYSAGERVQWKKNVGCLHEDCDRPIE